MTAQELITQLQGLIADQKIKPETTIHYGHNPVEVDYILTQQQGKLTLCHDDGTW